MKTFKELSWSKLEDVDFENLPVKTGDAVAITSALQLHSLLAADVEMVGKISTAGLSFINLQRAGQMGQTTFAEWLKRDMINAYIS
ncbi:GRAS protein tf80 [Trifolium repens]|nr:GRAS protein tf80 [Trifolium repens]